MNPILRFRLDLALAPNSDSGPWPDSALAATTDCEIDSEDRLKFDSTAAAGWPLF